MDLAAVRSLREESHFLFEHFKSEISRDNNINKTSYSYITALANCTSAKSGRLPIVSETVSGIEGIMNKLRLVIELHIDLGLKQISHNLKTICKEQSELMDKICVEMRSSLWFYMFALNSVSSVLQKVQREKDVFAAKAYKLAKIVSVLSKLEYDSKNNPDISDLLSNLTNNTKLYELEKPKEEEEEESFSKPVAELTDQQKQLKIDEQIELQIQYINNNPSLTDEQKEYRRQEILKSRKNVIATVTTKSGGVNSVAQAAPVNYNYIESIFVPNVGFVDKINVRKLEKYIKELQVSTVYLNHLNHVMFEI